MALCSPCSRESNRSLTGNMPTSDLKSSGLTLEAMSLAAIPVLLFLPVFYYSLTTPFALVDDYGDWH